MRHWDSDSTHTYENGGRNIIGLWVKKISPQFYLRHSTTQVYELKIVVVLLLHDVKRNDHIPGCDHLLCSVINQKRLSSLVCQIISSKEMIISPKGWLSSLLFSFWGRNDYFLSHLAFDEEVIIPISSIIQLLRKRVSILCHLAFEEEMIISSII